MSDDESGIVPGTMLSSILNGPLAELMCICEHEPHEGECPEMVRSIVGPPGPPWPCGCDEYCPNRELGDEG